MNYKFNVKGFTKKEAFKNLPFKEYHNVTQAYRKWSNENPNKDIDVFANEYIEKKGDVKSCGYYIILIPGAANNRMRPYNIIDYKRKEGSRKYKTIYQLIDENTNAIVASTEVSKAEAKNMAREMYKNGYTGNLKCIYTKQVIDGEPIAFTVSFSPSRSAREGQYYVFGVKH